MSPFDRLLVELKAPVISPRDVAQTLCAIEGDLESIYRMLEHRFRPAQIALIRQMVESRECFWESREAKKARLADPGKCHDCPMAAPPGQTRCHRCVERNRAAKKRYQARVKERNLRQLFQRSR